MLILSIALYIFAAILFFYIVYRVATTHEFKTGDAIATLGIVVSIILAISVRPQPPQPSPTPISTFASGPANWAVTFEDRLPINSWSIGLHQYTLSTKCPGEAPGSVTNNFTVSDSYAILPGDVYLRFAGIRKSKTYGAEPVDGINPSQPTVGVVSWDQITKSEANWRAANCTGTITWDGGTAQTLIAQNPFQH